MVRPLPFAVAALLVALAWRTERFQAWAFPERYHDAQVQRLREDIAFQRASIRDAKDELARMRQAAQDSPEDADVYLTTRRMKEEDIAAAEEMIAMYRADLEAARAGRR